jgi:NADH-quinone oxidoreductase subunit E
MSTARSQPTTVEPQGQSGILSEATRAAIRALHGKYPEIQSAILDALRLAQDEIGYLPVEATNEVAALLGLSPHHVRSLASFYTMFFTEPVGTHIVEVCDNLSCALWGSQRVLAKLEEELGISVGETTPDGSVTLLRTIECLAACGGAPALRVNTTYYEKMTDEKVVALVKALREPTSPAPLPKGKGENGGMAEKT